MFGQAICFGVGTIFGDCSDNQDGSGNKRKAVILIKVFLIFSVVTGAITTAAVMTTMQDKMDLITTLENDLTESVLTTVTEANFTQTISPSFSSSTTTIKTLMTTVTATLTTATTLTSTTKPDISCKFLEYLFFPVKVKLFISLPFRWGSHHWKCWLSLEHNRVICALLQYLLLTLQADR